MTLPRLFAALALAAAASACAPSALVASGALLTRSVFQERATLDALTDTEIAFGVQHRLAKHSGELYRDVSVDVVEGEVVLTGSVPRRADRIAATKAAWDTPSVIAVSDALVVAEDGGTSAYISDVRLANQVRYGLITDTSVRSINYTVTVVDGVVHLTGIARSTTELERAAGHAARVPGVERVVSHVLTINDPRRVKRLAAKDG